MRNRVVALWVKIRRRIARRLHPRTRLWLEAVRDTRRHNASVTSRNPAASSLCFYPERPTNNYAISRVAVDLGTRIVRSKRGEGLLTFAWRDATFVEPAAVESLPTPTLNVRCLDISKSKVDRIWAEVSGRSLSVDPLTTPGPMVVKSEENATHDGRIILGPIQERQPGFVYQRLVDNRVGNDFVILRPVVLDGRIVFTYHKRRPADDRFASRDIPARTRIGEPDVISVEEENAILDLAARIGLDYGEIEVLRDADGAIDVVDVNKTPWWPKGLSEAELKAVDELMAEAFDDLISRYRNAKE
jgi:hypothetical protein